MELKEKDDADCQLKFLEEDQQNDISIEANITLMKALPQILASIIALSVWFCIGVGGGFSAVLLPQLQANDSSIPVTEDQASWIASLLPLSTGIGAVVSAYLVDVVGRRETVKLQIIPIIVSWMVMFWAGNVVTLYTARILIGIASGMGTISTMYVTEVSHPVLRGSLCNMAILWASTGTFTSYVLGAVLPWRTSAAICGVFPIFTLIALFFVPESPRWLMAVGRKSDAEKAIKWFYSRDSELATSHWQALTREMSANQENPPLIKKLKGLFHPSSLKPLGVLFGFFVFQQLSGVYILLFYTVDLFQHMETDLNPFAATIMVGTVRMATGLIAVILSRRFGRRPLSITSGLGMTLTMVTAGTCLYLSEDDTITGWVSLSCVLTYMLFSSIGFLCFPWSMSAELLPLHARGLGGGLCNTVNHLLMFSVLKAYPYLMHTLHIHGILWFFAAASILGTIFVFLYLPETLGKTLPEIEEHFLSKKKKHVKIVK